MKLDPGERRDWSVVRSRQSLAGGGHVSAHANRLRHRVGASVEIEIVDPLEDQCLGGPAADESCQHLALAAVPAVEFERRARGIAAFNLRSRVNDFRLPMPAL